MSAAIEKIAAVADFSIGYGSPQLAALVRSLRDHWGASTAMLLEPDQSERPARHALFPDLSIRRVATDFPLYSAAGLVQYAHEAAAELNRLQPDVLVVTSPFVLPVLRKLRRRPRCTVYYMLESLAYYAEMDSRFWRLAPELVADASPRIDVVLSPEENRAACDLSRGELHGKPLAVLLNAVNALDAADHALPPYERDYRILYSGTIQRGLTFAEYFLDPRSSDLPIDLYGLVEGDDKAAVLDALYGVHGEVRYRGYVDARTLSELRKTYAYSISMWSPTNEHQRFAAPNKFFEAIADGVPPITAPHPQCKDIVSTYDCGIVMRDWSYRAFRDALDEAIDIFGTPRYAELVANCQEAVRREINWDAQFAKVVPHLKELRS